MRQTFTTLALAILCLCFHTHSEAKTCRILSPDKTITVTLGDTHGLWFKVSKNGHDIIGESAIGLHTTPDGNNIHKIKSVKTSTHQETIKADNYRQRTFTTNYNEAVATLDKGLQITLRVFDEGIAYRFSTKKTGENIVYGETARYHFCGNSQAWLPYSTNDSNPWAMAFQNTYTHATLSEAPRKMAFLPATVDVGKAKVTLMEAELKSYPGMFVMPDGDILEAHFAPYPKSMEYYKWRHMTHVSSTEDFIATSQGPRHYPWRILAITTDDRQMPLNNMVYALSEPSRIADTSWIKPGKVAWDWWNDWNLRGVDFKAGINTQTYEYYIDFASRHGLEYVVLDEGWYDSAKGDILNPIADIDLKHLIDYGRERNVGIILWTVFNVLDENLEEACVKYHEMGAKGFKVDFLDRDDQTATEMAYRIAETCARHQMLLDYHGYYKPTGMSRTWPNILNYEGVFGMEEARWATKDTDMPLYDVTFPFIRMMAGSMDFTPGALRNGTRNNWVMCYENPMSMGTRCHQLACYVIHDSPLTMLCDAPTNYEREPECTSIITSIPCTFERTIIPLGKMGEYIVTARQAGSNWYVGGQTNWDARSIKLPMAFLEKGIYDATIVTDGINASHNAEDFRIEKKNISANDTITIDMASGGGFVMIMKAK